MLNEQNAEQQIVIESLKAELERSKFRANKYKADTRMYQKKIERLEAKIIEMRNLTGTDVHAQNVELLARIHMLEHNIRRYKSTLDDTRPFDRAINDGNIRTFINKIKANANG